MNCINHPDTPAVAYCRTCGKALCQGCQRTAQGTVYCAEHVPGSASTPVSGQPPAPIPPYSAAGPGVPPPPNLGSTSASPTPVSPPSPSTTPADAYAENLRQRIEKEAAAGSIPAWKTAVGSAPPPHTPPGATPYTAGDPGASPGLAFILGLIPGVGAIYNGQYVKGLIHVIILGILISIVSSDASAGLTPLFGMLIAVWWAYMAFEAYHTARKRQFGLPVDEFSSIVPLHSNRRGFPLGPVILIGFGVLFLMNTMDILRFDRMIRYWPVLLIVLGGYMLYERISGSEPIVQKEFRNEPR